MDEQTMSRIAVGQMLTSFLLAVLDETDATPIAIRPLKKLHADGNDIAGAGLELVALARRNMSVFNPPPGMAPTPEADLYRYSAATPFLLTMLVAPIDGDAVVAVTHALHRGLGADHDEVGSDMYSTALEMLNDARALHRAARETNRQFGV